MKRHARAGKLPKQIEIQADQPVIRSSLERFVLAVDRSDPGVTAYAGLPLAMETFAALGLGEACQRELALKKRQRGPTEAEWGEMFVMLHLAGGQGLEDVEVLKQDDGLVRLWPAIQNMSPRSALDFLLRFHDRDQKPAAPGQAVIHPPTAGLEGLRRVNAHLLRQVQDHHPAKTATLDLDASIHACDKQAALRTYEGPRGYQPVIVYWAEQGLVVHDQFRDGNVPAAMGNREVLECALANLPDGLQEKYVRGDSALYDHEVLRFLDREGVSFAVSADMTQQLKAEIQKLPAGDWRLLDRRDGSAGEPGRRWAEVPFVPDDPVARKGERPFRYWAIRLPPKPRQLELFEPPSTTEEYVAVVTNRELPGDELIHWHRGKCGTVEHAHDQIKHDVGARLMPSSAFGANAAWYRLAILALNLYRAMSLLALPEDWRSERLETIRFRLLNRAGRVISHSRRYVLVLSQLALPLLDICLHARQNLAGLAST